MRRRVDSDESRANPSSVRAPMVGALVRVAARWTDQLAAADPGLNRLRVATRTALSIALTLFGEWAFVGLTGALEKPVPLHATPAQAAAIGDQHHEVLVIAMLIGALTANLAGLNANEPTRRARQVTLVYIPGAIIGSLVLGLALGTHRDLALVVMVLVLVAGTYARRWGQRGAATGIVVFIGYFYGFFLSSALGLGAAGWLAAEVGIGGAATIVVRLFFRDSPQANLRRAVRSYRARLQKLMTLSLSAFDERTDRRRRALQRWTVRLDEAALIVEGQLSRVGAASPSEAAALYRQVFDVEVAVTNVARFVDMLVAVETDPERCLLVRRALAALAAGDAEAARRSADELRALTGAVPPGPGPLATAPEGGDALAGGAGSGSPGSGSEGDAVTRWVILHRFANAVYDLARTIDAWDAVLPRRAVATEREESDEPAAEAFQAAVTLRGGWLPGSADVSVEASTSTSRVRLSPYLRTAAQMAVAITIAIVAGDALDSQRFYWAVVAALLALVGTNTVAEQLRKATQRVIGTLAGIVIGTALVDLVGHHSVWSLVVVVVSMWIGIYYFRVNYAVMALAVTVSLAQAYVSLGEFSNGLLWERLAETAVGAAAAMLTVVVVLPLRTSRVVEVAMARVVEAVVSLAECATVALEGRKPPASLRQAARQVDAAFQALLTTAEPLRLVTWTGASDRLERQLASVIAARNYARNLVADVGRATCPLPSPALDEAREVLRRSAAVLVGRLRGEGGGPAVYVRAGALFAEAGDLLSASKPAELEEGRHDGPRGGRLGLVQVPRGEDLALRDLVLLDNALADLALVSGLRVERVPASALVEHAEPALPARSTTTEPPRATGPTS